MIPLKDMTTWQQVIQSQWPKLLAQAQALDFSSPYQTLIAMALAPVLPTDADAARALAQALNALSTPGTEVLAAFIAHDLAQHSDPNSAPPRFSLEAYTEALCVHLESAPQASRAALDRLLIALGLLNHAPAHAPQGPAFLQCFSESIHADAAQPGRLHLHADLIRAARDVNIAGRDNITINVLATHYKGDKAALKSYLAGVRSDWNTANLDAVMSEALEIAQLPLHQLFTPMDIWKPLGANDIDMATLRERAIDHDMNAYRVSALKMIAAHPLAVITGGAGTGKSTLSRFIAACLAYACDPEAEAADGVDGLALLGPAWTHGALLPIYVSLHRFSANEQFFPAKPGQHATAETLLRYLTHRMGSFGPHLECYLTDTEVPYHGAFLILDGLDEVYRREDRIKLKRIIERWSQRFPKCRVLVTSRNYAYRESDSWRLMPLFKTAELAPYTWPQIKDYVTKWYYRAALNYPGRFGGREGAEARAQTLSYKLTDALMASSKRLWSLARQPLLLTLIVLTHYQNRALPRNRADLYERMVQLLEAWNPPHEEDPLAQKLAGLKPARVRHALQLVAFNMQRDHTLSDRASPRISKAALTEALMKQHSTGGGLGADVDVVLESLGTRNGILVSDRDDSYRFLHTTLQEYFAARALMALYDECSMPLHLTPDPDNDGWDFPDNLVKLLMQDQYRWREVALMAGSILASGINEKARWHFIEDLLPDSADAPMNDGQMYAVYIAAEVWAEVWLKARKTSQRSVYQQLLHTLERVAQSGPDAGLDVVEQSRVRHILALLTTHGA